MDIFYSLCRLYHAVHSQFYSLETDTYCDAMSEITQLAWNNGYTINDLAVAVTTI